MNTGSKASRREAGRFDSSFCQVSALQRGSDAKQRYMLMSGLYRLIEGFSV